MTAARVVLAGGPRTGKTTAADAIAARRGLVARHTDDLIGRFKWSEDSAEVARWFDVEGPWVIEGVAAVRALRKWLEARPAGRPCDRVLWMHRAKVARTAGQETMAKGAATVWSGVVRELRARGVLVEAEA